VVLSLTLELLVYFHSLHSLTLVWKISGLQEKSTERNRSLLARAFSSPSLRHLKVLCLEMPEHHLIDVLEAVASYLHPTLELLQVHTALRVRVQHHGFRQLAPHVARFAQLTALCIDSAAIAQKSLRRPVPMASVQVLSLAAYLTDRAPSSLEEVACHILVRPTMFADARLKLQRVRSINAVAIDHHPVESLVQLTHRCPDLRHLRFGFQRIRFAQENGRSTAPQPALVLPSHFSAQLETLQLGMVDSSEADFGQVLCAVCCRSVFAPEAPLPEWLSRSAAVVDGPNRAADAAVTARTGGAEVGLADGR
jgi:hypothetical protein